MLTKRSFAHIAVGMVCLALSWQSAHGGSFSDSTAIEEIIVVGARSPRSATEVVGKVDVITHAQLIDKLATSFSDVARYTPGVGVATADSRFGDTELTIRGLSGNRVASLIDGVPVPNQFDIGAFANAGQDFLIPDAISRIEVLRGPASTLFGNDALGGVVAVVTRDPGEFLLGRNSHLGGSVVYNGRDDATSVSLATALGSGSGNQTGVLHLYRQEGHEINRSAVTTPDRQDGARQSVYTKLTHVLPSGNRLHLNASVFDEVIETDMVSVLGYGRQFRNTTSLTGDDQRRRYAVTGTYEFTGNRFWFGAGRANVYFQQVDVRQQTTESRENLTPPVRNERTFRYDTETLGVTIDLDRSFATPLGDHRIAWGAAMERSKIEERRDGMTTDLASGVSSNVMLGETMPVRDFPNSTADEMALYVHDEISFGPVTVIPGLRFQSYHLDAKTDSVYAADNPSTPITDTRESSLAPKLGVLWHTGPDTQIYLQYAHGFRAPPFEDVNIGLDIPRFNIRALPNPDLVPETSDGLELGARLYRDRYRFDVALFAVDYDNLIATKVNLGPDPGTGILLFQSRNIDKARVYGLEASYHASLERWIPGLSFDTAATWTRGDNETTNEPLNTVDPPELVAAVNWQPNERWRVALITTAVARQDRIDETLVDLFATDEFLVVDLTASYQFSAGTRLDLGVFNAFDKTYWRWSSLRNRNATDPMIDHLSAPRRYATVSIRMDL